GDEVVLGRKTEAAELPLHFAADDRAQLLAAAATDLDELVNGRAELVARELTLCDEIRRQAAGLRPAQLRELHTGLQHTLPIRRLGHRSSFHRRRGGLSAVAGKPTGRP